MVELCVSVIIVKFVINCISNIICVIMICFWVVFDILDLMFNFRVVYVKFYWLVIIDVVFCIKIKLS